MSHLHILPFQNNGGCPLYVTSRLLDVLERLGLHVNRLVSVAADHCGAQVIVIEHTDSLRLAVRHVAGLMQRPHCWLPRLQLQPQMAMLLAVNFPRGHLIILTYAAHCVVLVLRVATQECGPMHAVVHLLLVRYSTGFTRFNSLFLSDLRVKLDAVLGTHVVCHLPLDLDGALSRHAKLTEGWRIEVSRCLRSQHV